MNITEENIYRQKKYRWTPLLSFGGGLTGAHRDGFDGWHNAAPYGTNTIRTLGVRWKDNLGNVVKESIAYRKTGTYETFNTQAGYTCEVNFDPSLITAIWYRYRNVDAILYPTSQMKLLEILSFREHMIDFGDLDLSNSPNFTHLEISSGGSINSVTFHPDAPLKFAYIDGTPHPVSFKDTLLTQAYIHRDTVVPANLTNTKSLDGVLGFSASLQYMADELINNYGFSIT